MEVIVHIGAHKTGTTSIQDFLFSRRDELLNRENILYPTSRSIGFKQNHTDLTAGVFHNHDDLGRMVVSRIKSSGAERDVYYGTYVEELRSEIEASSCDKVVLSTEAFFRHANDFDWHKLSRDIGIPLEFFRFVVYLRDPAHHYLSLVQQRIKYSSRFKSPKSVPFRKVVQSYEDKFPGRVSIRILELVSDSVADIKSVIGIKAYDEFDNPVERKNESLSAEAMQLIQLYRQRFMSDLDNVVDAKGRRLLQVVMNADANLVGGIKPKLFQNVYDSINLGVFDDISWLESQCEVDIPWKISQRMNKIDTGGISLISDICFVDKDRLSMLNLHVFDNLLAGQVG